MVVTSLPLVEKKARMSGAGFFLCFLYASARTVTCVMVMVVVMVVLMRFMDVVYS